MSRQLALGLRLSSEPCFDHFIPGENREALAAVRAAASGEGERFLSLWGEAGCGKSHLLQAACLSADGGGQRAFYLRLSHIPRAEPDLLLDLQAFDLIAIDDLDAIAGQATWEEALYRLYNDVRGNSGRLLTAFRPPLAGLPLGLSDLKSRLGWGPSYRLTPLNDDDKGKVLRLAAGQRGLGLPDETLAYLLTHYSRDLTRLLHLLDRLDQASLEAKRRLTLPFVRQWLLEHASSLGTPGRVES